MIKPNKTEIRRSFQNGIQVMYRVSPHQMQFHAKIHRLQVYRSIYYTAFEEMYEFIIYRTAISYITEYIASMVS